MKEAIEGLARAIDRKNEEINKLLNEKTEYVELVRSLCANS